MERMGKGLGLEPLMSDLSARSDCGEGSQSENGSGRQKARPASNEDAAQGAATYPERHSGENQSFVPVCFGLALPNDLERNCAVDDVECGQLSVPVPAPVLTPGCSTS